MTHRLALLLCVLLGIAGCRSKPAADEWNVSIRGYGPIHTGMTLEQADSAGGRRLTRPATGSEECDYIQFGGDSTRGVHFMVVDNRIARVDIQDSTVATNHGARIGDSEEKIKRLYPGRVTVQPHKYTDGHYLVVAPESQADRGFEIIFETDGNRVTTYRSGRVPEVRFVEGCS
jgi:hypothetical protein